MTKMNGTPLKPDRKTTERNRRIHMKSLCFKLSSLIPPNQFKTSKESRRRACLAVIQGIVSNLSST
ncbi:hypothetical protein CK203_089605 [Vitis vinifera]|uniref:BHLH domain-containing protein n=1 Tax=Vitis vinifera TaxID=29760 RepID=A0A438EZL9_VITVI|nr:hypothetical protein CK203_089605 [Vitis vinifera]